MALSTTATISFAYAWNQVDTASSTLYSDIGRISHTGALTNATTGVSGIIIANSGNQVNGLWNSSITLGSGAGTTLDLYGLSRTLLGNSYNVAFSGNAARIRSIVIKNTNNVPSGDFSIRATGASAFTGPFNGSSGNVLVPAASMLMLHNPLVGWVANTGQRYLQLRDTGYSSTLDICIVGVTGTG
jgi:hypothetical protein